MPLGPLAALFSSITWALGSTTYARVAATTTPPAIHFTRALLALPAFFLTVLLTTNVADAFAPVTRTHLGWLVISMLTSFVIGDVFFLFSATSIGVPAALAIASSYPIWSAIAGGIVHGEPLTFVKWVALIGVVVGVSVVILSGAHLERRPHYARGIVFALATSVCWAVNTVATARGGNGLNSGVVNVIRMVIALMLCPWVGWWLTGKPTFCIARPDLRRYGWIFLAEAYGGSLGFVYGLTHAPLAVAAALSSLAPVIATPIAWIGRHEPVSVVKLAGILLVVASAYYLVVP